MRKAPLWRQLAAGAAVAIAVYAVAQFLWATRALLLAAILGIIFGATAGKGVDLLQRLRIPRSIGAVLVVAAGIAAAVALGWIVAPQLGSQMRDVERQIPGALDRLEDELRGRTVAGVPIDMPQLTPARIWRRLAAADSAALSKLLFPFVSSSVAAIASALVVLFIALYVAAEPELYVRGVLRLVTPARRDDARHLLGEVGSMVTQWLLARLLAMIAIGLVTTAGLWVLDVPAPVALGAIAGLLEFIPFFGPIASAIPAMAMAVLVSPMTVFYVAVLFIVIQQLEGNVITPLIMRSRIEVPPLLTILAVSGLGVVFGVAGMLVAEPLTAIAIVLTRHIYVEPMEKRTVIQAVQTAGDDV